MPLGRPGITPWKSRVLAGFVILAAEAFSIRATGIKGDIWGAGPILTGGNQFFRLFILPFLLTLLYVAVIRLRAAQYCGEPPAHPSRIGIAAHLACLGVFTALTLFLTHRQPHDSSPATLVALWFSIGMATAVTGILAAFGRSMIAPSTGAAALTVGAFAVASLAGMPLVERSWNYDSNVTVNAATGLLQHMGLDVRAEGKVIRTPHFKVIITPACSGYEGIGLFLIFAITWLAWFRREYRFPAALLLLPAGVALSWSLNVARIAGYVLIGHFGHKEIAMNGFHSWAGLIAFTVLALTFCSVSPRMPGIGAGAVAATVKPPRAKAATDPIFYFLGPFLAMQAASMISRAASGGMEWLYPLRVLAAAAVLWLYRKHYAAIEWDRKPSWFAGAVGVAAAVLWTLSAWRLPAGPGPWTQLAQAALAWRIVWLAFRILGGVLMAPLVEELAFRGFLMRRVQGAEFVAVDARRCGWLAIALSSLLFGLMHGPRFVEGTAAGALYGYAYTRRGKLGDAIAAHALTNLLLAVVVAATGDWRYW